MSIFKADNAIQPFKLEDGSARGRLVRLGTVADTILARQAYPPPVATLLGELLGLTAVVAGGFKFEGICTVQIKSDGPIDTMVADFETPGILRAYARHGEALSAAEAGAGAAVPRLLGAGHLVFTIDQGADTERYQGYVALEGATIADCAHNYFRQSEQLEAAVRLAAAQRSDGWRIGALMLQRLPADAATDEADEEREEGWRHALALFGSLTDTELTDPELDPDQLLYRLFHESGVRVFESADLNDGCRCSRARIERVLASFGADELEDLKEDDGAIRATCEFCAQIYVFDEYQISQLQRP
jgi:molecular chaperone Hsp33